MREIWNGKKVKMLREKLGITQMELARKLGYKTYWAIFEWEAGRRKIPEQAKKLLTLINEGKL